MYKKIIKFDDTEIEEHEFHQSKSPILIKDVDINKTLVSNKLPFGKEDFIYFLVTKIITQLDPYAYFFQKFGLKDIVTQLHIFILR